MLNILIACENSNTMSSAFRKLGHKVLSADLLPSPDNCNHYQGDVFNLDLSSFDFIFAFPPCTYLCKAQMSQCNKDVIRKSKQSAALQFFLKIYYSNCKHIAIENPPGALTKLFRPADQTFSPHLFGDIYQKQISLWLKNCPPVIINPSYEFAGKLKSVNNHCNSRMSQDQRSQIRSSWKYFPRMSSALAIHFTNFFNHENELFDFNQTYHLK